MGNRVIVSLVECLPTVIARGDKDVKCKGEIKAYLSIFTFMLVNLVAALV